MFTKSPKLKLAMIPILASVLGFVLMSESENPSNTVELVTKDRETLVSTKKQVEWPHFEIEEIALLQPFRTIHKLDELSAEEIVDAKDPTNTMTSAPSPNEETLEVRAVFQTTRGAAALVGDRVVRVGDVLPNGKRVAAIHPDGIEVAKD